MKFAKRLFVVAGIYGLLGTLPLYFMEAHVGIDSPPAITHPEYYYGFAGVAAAWQILFFIIASDPTRYRLAILPGALEKMSFGCAALALYLIGRTNTQILLFGAIDLVFAVLFIAAFLRLSPTHVPPSSR